MSLAERLQETPERNFGMPCSIGTLLNTLPADEVAALQAMLGTPEQRSPWTASEIYDALQAEGHTVGYQTIGRHRGRKCRCFR